MNGGGALLDGDDFSAMVVAAADVVDANVGLLSRLDAASGDGDHGANAQRAMSRARASLDELTKKLPAAVLDALASACAEAMAGASGAVFSSFFAGAAAAIGDERSVDASLLARSFAAGLQRVQQVGGAHVGDKTIVDALGPAVAAAESASRRTADVGQVLGHAATAARGGAEATSDLAASVGRARYAESGGRGWADPGATTIALIFEAWADAVHVSLSTSLDGDNRIDSSAVSPWLTDHRSTGRH